MTESFLHYIWQFQYFDKTNLSCSTGEEVMVIHPGLRNAHAGPDFFNAKIRIGTMEWIGTVEIHVFSSAWKAHNHDSDAAYENVILHVVWEDDLPVHRRDGSLIPTLSLKNRIEAKYLIPFKKLIQDPSPIPCSSSLPAVQPITRLAMLDKALMIRLERKADYVIAMLRKNNDDWEETCYQLLGRNFGFKVNAEPFQQLTKAVPYKLVLKHADNLQTVEAMLFGAAGFLEESGADEYYRLLLQEYRVMKAKFNLYEKQMNGAQWRFLRLRPANFPTLRIAEFASVITHQKNIFSTLLECLEAEDIRRILDVKPSAYWEHHYQFFKYQPRTITGLGLSSIENVVINTVVPLLVAYGKAKDDQAFTDRAVSILNGIRAEDNAIIRSWAAAGITCTSGFDSQSLIELYTGFCQKKRCLDCSIGFSIIQPIS